jgi:hypothetical protein
MASVEEISQSIQLRLEELLDEADRLRAAIEALGAVDPDTGRAQGMRLATRPVPQTLTNHRTRLTGEHNEQEPVNTRRGYVIPPTAANGDAGDGDDCAPVTPRDRALSQLRRELTAGLRNT